MKFIEDLNNNQRMELMTKPQWTVLIKIPTDTTEIYST